MTLVLGIETSCDETSASVVEGRGDEATVRSLVILSQDVHRVFGGVVPEIASRAHLTAIVPVVRRALEESGVALRELDAIAAPRLPRFRALDGRGLVELGHVRGVLVVLDALVDALDERDVVLDDNVLVSDLERR